MFKFKVLQLTRFSTFNFGELRKKRKKDCLLLEGNVR